MPLFLCLSRRREDRIAIQIWAVMSRYFPDVEHAWKSSEAQFFVLDGELVISIDGIFSFESLLERMNPSSILVMELARNQPAVLLIFDILVADDCELLANHLLKG